MSKKNEYRKFSIVNKISFDELESFPQKLYFKITTGEESSEPIVHIDEERMEVHIDIVLKNPPRHNKKGEETLTGTLFERKNDHPPRKMGIYKIYVNGVYQNDFKH